MGRSYTPVYRVEYATNARGVHHTAMVWDCKRYGKPTRANLIKWREGYNKSFEPGGVNEHCSNAVGYIIWINRARIIRQKTDEVVAEFVAPMFEVA